MIFKTEEDLKTAFRTAAQTEKFRQKDGSFPPFVLPNEIKTTTYVKQVLLPQIPDMRVRQIIWLRSEGMCWKNIGKESNLNEDYARKLFRLQIQNLFS